MGFLDTLLSRAPQDVRRLEPNIELLRKSPLLDPVWYRQNSRDLRANPVDAARHYLEHGAAEGRNPHPLFDTKWYLSHTPEAAASGVNPLVHYLQRTSFEHCYPHPLFDVDLYIKSSSDFASSGL